MHNTSFCNAIRIIIENESAVIFYVFIGRTSGQGINYTIVPIYFITKNVPGSNYKAIIIITNQLETLYLIQINHHQANLFSFRMFLNILQFNCMVIMARSLRLTYYNATIIYAQIAEQFKNITNNVILLYKYPSNWCTLAQCCRTNDFHIVSIWYLKRYVDLTFCDRWLSTDNTDHQSKTTQTTVTIATSNDPRNKFFLH